jgi:hypothetical protein
MTTWSAVMWMLRTAAPSDRRVIGVLGAPEWVMVTSVLDKSPPVKHSVVPGEAASRAAGTWSA